MVENHYLCVMIGFVITVLAIYGVYKLFSVSPSKPISNYDSNNAYKNYNNHIIQKSSIDTMTNSQKRIILLSLVTIASADEKISKEESEYYKNTAKFLDYHIIDINDMINSHNKEIDMQLMPSIFELDEIQKDFAILSLFGMAMSDGKFDDREAFYALRIYESMGISDSRVNECLLRHGLV